MSDLKLPVKIMECLCIQANLIPSFSSARFEILVRGGVIFHNLLYVRAHTGARSVPRDML